MKKIALFIIKMARKLFYNTPVHRSKTVNYIYERLFHIAFDKNSTTTVNYMGSKFVVPTKDITILPSLLNNNYEVKELEILKEVLKPGMKFVDVGANVGLFSVIGAKAVGLKGRVYSFEPEPDNYSILLENLKTNNITNITAENLALGNKKSNIKLYIEGNSIGTHSLLKNKKNSIGNVIVQVVTLDDYFINSENKIDVLKIDVEGYEPFVLEGAEKTLKNVKYLFIEFNGSDIDAHYGIDKFQKLINTFPYLYSINEKKQTVSIFTPEMFHDTKYVNILATREKYTI